VVGQSEWRGCDFVLNDPLTVRCLGCLCLDKGFCSNLWDDFCRNLFDEHAELAKGVFCGRVVNHLLQEIIVAVYDFLGRSWTVGYGCSYGRDLLVVVCYRSVWIKRRTPTIKDLLCHFCYHFKVVEVDNSEEGVDLFNKFCFGRHDC
jgi:hypothetical protein